MIEFVGISVAFFVVNLAIGVSIVASIRILTPGFLSAYVVNDISLLALSSLQGLFFGSWRKYSPR